MSTVELLTRKVVLYEETCAEIEWAKTICGEKWSNFRFHIMLVYFSKPRVYHLFLCSSKAHLNFRGFSFYEIADATNDLTLESFIKMQKMEILFDF